ncbi:thymidylate synthase [uncultured Tateyamaria sp.]|uniref:thymidylate synthase n=1 Tax=uncultured Tateyamaria sp. TaxID=455651 RepID=UPI00263086B4|nr:thymidylate synthase [uncultured Tateyamaria sp.]
MKRTAAVCALVALVAACGDGNPFTDNAEDGDTTPTTPTDPGAAGITIPASIASDLSGFTFVPDPSDPNGGTLTVEGVFLDEDLLDSAYSRAPALDVPGYIAFTAQDDPIDQHATAYVQSLNGTRAGVIVTGGQFGTFNGGAAYARDGDFDRPTLDEDTGQVSYAGTYVGVTNLDGDPTDLLPFPAGTDPALATGQAAVVTGEIFLNVDFSDNAVNGAIFNRNLDLNDDDEFGVMAPGETTLDVDTLQLDPSVIDEDGTFVGNIVLEGDTTRGDIGDYAGIFGGVDSEAVSGAIFVADHLLDGTTAEEEYGIFVLGRCGGPLESAAVCADVDG